MPGSDEATLPPQSHEQRVLSEAAAEDRSLIDDVEALIEDGKTYLEAELNYQKTRAAFAGGKARLVAVLALTGLTFAWMALIGLTVGLIIALTPPLSAWGATAVVVLLWLLIAVSTLSVAASEGRKLAKSFQSGGGSEQ